MLKQTFSSCVVFKTRSFPGKGGPCQALQRAQGFLGSPGLGFKFPGLDVLPELLTAPGQGAKEGIVTLATKNQFTPRIWWLGSWLMLDVCYVSQAHLIGG